MDKIEFKDYWELTLFTVLFSAIVWIPIYQGFFVSNQINDIKERALKCFDIHRSKDALRECVQEEFPN